MCISYIVNYLRKICVYIVLSVFRKCVQNHRTIAHNTDESVHFTSVTAATVAVVPDVCAGISFGSSASA